MRSATPYLSYYDSNLRSPYTLQNKCNLKMLQLNFCNKFTFINKQCRLSLINRKYILLTFFFLKYASIILTSKPINYLIFRNKMHISKQVFALFIHEKQQHSFASPKLLCCRRQFLKPASRVVAYVGTYL